MLYRYTSYYGEYANMHFIIGNLENTEIYVKDNVKVSLNPSHTKVKFLMYLLLVFPFFKAKYDLTLKTNVICHIFHFLKLDIFSYTIILT